MAELQKGIIFSGKHAMDKIRRGAFTTLEDGIINFRSQAHNQQFSKKALIAGERVLRLHSQLKGKKLGQRIKAKLRAEFEECVNTLKSENINCEDIDGNIEFIHLCRDITVSNEPESKSITDEQILNLLTARMQALGIQPPVIAPALALAGAPSADVHTPIDSLSSKARI